MEVGSGRSVGTPDSAKNFAALRAAVGRSVQDDQRWYDFGRSVGRLLYIYAVNQLA